MRITPIHLLSSSLKTIGLDASAFRPYKGNSVYALCLVRELAKLNNYTKFTIQISARNQNFFNALSGEKNVDLRLVQQRRLERMVGHSNHSDYDLFHLPGGQEPLWCHGPRKLPVVFTFHDANYLQARGSLLWKTYKVLSTAAMLRRASGVIFISKFAYDEFCRIRYFKQKLERIPNRVIWNGTDFPAVKPSGQIKAGPWICFANQTHKRADIAIAAFEERWRQQPADEKLIVIGSRPPGVITRAPVEFRASLEQRELTDLVAGAKGLLFPSEYEGFGLPVLEAAISGVPVISNNLPAVREVFGETICYATHNTVGEYVAWMSLFDQQQSDVWPRAHKAWEKARLLTWRRCAEQVSDFYGEVVTKFKQ